MVNKSTAKVLSPILFRTVFHAVKDIRLCHHLLLIPIILALHPSDPYRPQRSRKKPKNATPKMTILSLFQIKTHRNLFLLQQVQVQAFENTKYPASTQPHFAPEPLHLPPQEVSVP